jgi:hypothetical protein
MKKQILHFNETAFQKSVNDAKELVSLGQKTLDLHYRIGNLFKLDTITMITDILQGGEQKYKELVMDNIDVPEISQGLKMKREVFIENIEWPDLSEIKRIQGGVARYLSGANLCKLNGKGISLDDAAVQQHRELYTVYADTPRKEDVMNAHIEAAAALSKLDKLLKKEGKMGIDLHLSKYSTLFQHRGEQIEHRSEYYYTGDGRFD